MIDFGFKNTCDILEHHGMHWNAHRNVFYYHIKIINTLGLRCQFERANIYHFRYTRSDFKNLGFQDHRGKIGLRVIGGCPTILPYLPDLTDGQTDGVGREGSCEKLKFWLGWGFG